MTNMNRTPMSQSYMNSQAGSAEQRQQQQQQQQPTSSDSNATNTTSSASSNQQTQQGSSNPTSNAGNIGQLQAQFGNEQMSQLMCATELTNLLLEFAFSVFIHKPQDIIDYAATYFSQLKSQRAASGSSNNNNNNNINIQSSSGEPNISLMGSGGKRASSDSQRSNLSNSNNNNTNNNNSEDEFDLNDQPMRVVNFATSTNQSSQPKLSFNRRKSVFAEQYDPAADQEDDENSRVVHSKTDEQRVRLAKAIKSIFIFRSVNEPQDIAHILDAMFEVKVSAGDVVIRQGDDGDNFYVVESGRFQIYVQQDNGEKQIRGEYENTGSFGELALMYNQPRAATVIALTDGSLWAMDRNTFRRIVLKSAFRKRKEYEALFEKVSVLQCLNGYERMNLCDALESKRFLNGQMIIVQGDQANGMYFIESGNVKIVKQLEDGRVIDVAILGKGDYFGELALINHKPRAASVYAMGDDVKLAFLDVKAFERLLGSCIERMEKNCAMYLKELAHNEARQNV